MPKPQVTHSDINFWGVFAGQFPIIPSIDELFCRIITLAYPKGVLTDKNGKKLPVTGPYKIATQRIEPIIEAAVAQEDAFMNSQLHEHGLSRFDLRKYDNCCNFGKAEDMVREAIAKGGLENLNLVFWGAYWRVVRECQRERRDLFWQLFA
ncbi:hypothetical protein GGR57DRAFT_456193 [Xylariaceae sp. FL1272]|nr:hypothetical protein GGR57DRAFT_456193 [Xylariaceae sp. FL1272]